MTFAVQALGMLCVWSKASENTLSILKHPYQPKQINIEGTDLREKKKKRHFDVYSYDKNVAHGKIDSWLKTGEVCLKPSKCKRGACFLSGLL